jgi:hypothetical protein
VLAREAQSVQSKVYQEVRRTVRREGVGGNVGNGQMGMREGTRVEGKGMRQEAREGGRELRAGEENARHGSPPVPSSYLPLPMTTRLQQNLGMVATGVTTVAAGKVLGRKVPPALRFNWVYKRDAECSTTRQASSFVLRNARREQRQQQESNSNCCSKSSAPPSNRESSIFRDDQPSATIFQCAHARVDDILTPNGRAGSPSPSIRDYLSSQNKRRSAHLYTPTTPSKIIIPHPLAGIHDTSDTFVMYRRYLGTLYIGISFWAGLLPSTAKKVQILDPRRSATRSKAGSLDRPTSPRRHQVHTHRSPPKPSQSRDSLAVF